jgi:hypothetical protein
MLIFVGNYTTTVLPLTLETLNLTWTQDLADSTTPEFMYHSNKLCSDVSK